MRKNKWLLLLLLAVLIKSLIWLVMTPIFQVPDEPSHFSLIEFMAEFGRRPHPRREVVTPAEVSQVAKIVNFNWQITHPVWQGYSADWRNQLLELPQASRQQVVANEFQSSLKRPPGYYWLAMPVYWFGGSEFLTRFFSVRFINVVIHFLTVWLAFLISKKVFNSANLGFAVAALVGFQPMLSFFSVGVHYDPLAIFLTSLFVYLMAVKKQFPALMISLTGVLVKPDLIILPLVWLGKRFWLGIVGLLALFAFVARPFNALIQGRVTAYDQLIYLLNINEYSEASLLLWQKLSSGQLIADGISYLEITGKMHLAQIFPWYWGTFGWLEAPLPAGVFTAIKVVILVSVLGWIKYIHHHRFPRKMIFWFGFCLLQAALVIANDFQFFTSRGEIYGIQGRYFFPAIIPQMLLLIFGLRQWIEDKVLAYSIFGLSFLLNLVGLITVFRYFGWVW